MAALSLNAIAREMGLTGPALYRYFQSRDALLAELIVDAYGDLAEVLETAAREADGDEPSARLGAVARAYRTWALAQPRRYAMLFGTPMPGFVAPDTTVGAAHRAMAVLLDLLVALAPAQWPDAGTPLDGQLETWVRQRQGGQAVPGPIARLGLTAWVRLHGLVSLEIQGNFAGMGFDPSLLLDAEIAALTAELP